MTKLFTLFALAALCLAGLTARAGDTNALVGKAMTDATIKTCVQDARSPNTEILSGVTETTGTAGFCLTNEKSYRVDFYKQYKCQPNTYCIMAPTVIVASAEFGCGGELTAAICY